MGGYKAVADFLHISEGQVRRAVKAERLTPKKKSGRPPKFNERTKKELVAYVTKDRKNRRLTYQQVADKNPQWGASRATTARALKSCGYRRCVAKAKPELTEKHKASRLAFAQERSTWTPQQWGTIAFSDETWVTYGAHKKIRVTRMKGEEMLEDCLRARYQRPLGWMFWGMMYEGKKGPSLVWRREWGNINGENYCKYTIPLVEEFVKEKRAEGKSIQFMHDNAPGHASKATKAHLSSLGLQPIDWPALSPDLNPIEHCWNLMKDYLQHTYGDRKFGKAELYEKVLEAWDVGVTEERIISLTNSMPKRCREVIAANGGNTSY